MNPFQLGLDPLTVGVVRDVAERRRSVTFDDAAARGRMERSHATLIDAIEAGRTIYGVTTGFGASCETRVAPSLTAMLAQNLHRYHGIGVGAPLADEDVRAVLLARAASMARGLSGVRPLVVDRILAMLDRDVLPVIPSRGSVGASGDLTPLSYVAATLVGEREARVGGRTLPSAEALRSVGIEPITLAPKESLAIMNGTSVMAAITARGSARARRIAELACAATAVASYATGGQAGHFDARIFEAKPHPGTITAAARIRSALGRPSRIPIEPGRIQDRYSIRCAPHVIGVLFDALESAERWVEIELDGVSDNPLVDSDAGEFLHGGNFYGGHVGFAADSLKQTVASVAELLERQIVLLNASATNGGLPTNLVAADAHERSASHGFKALEITASALVAEALKTATPACLYSRSTEGHNQDKVSMGSIAALELTHVLDLAETVVALHLLASVQAAELRCGDPPADVAALASRVRSLVEPVTQDRPLDGDASRLLAAIRTLELDAPGAE